MLLASSKRERGRSNVIASASLSKRHLRLHALFDTALTMGGRLLERHHHGLLVLRSCLKKISPLFSCGVAVVDVRSRQLYKSSVVFFLSATSL